MSCGSVIGRLVRSRRRAFASGHRHLIGRLSMHRPEARSVHRKEQVSSTSSTLPPRRSWSSAGVSLRSSDTVASTGGAIFLLHMGWLMMQRRLRDSRNQCGAGFARLVGDCRARRRIRHTFYQMLGHVMDMLRPNHELQRTRRGRRGCNRCVPCAGSLNLGRSLSKNYFDCLVDCSVPRSTRVCCS